MIVLLALALLGAPPPDVVVNRFATVQSADGYLNLRATPSSEIAADARMPNGARVLVLMCTSAPRGRRWCRVLHADRYGYAYDAELAYAPRARPTDTVAGAGVPRDFRAVDDEAVVRSADGYVNLRTGPSTSDGVLRRLPTDELLWVLGCRAGRAGERWCLVETTEAAGVFGYVFDRELVYAEHEDHEH